MNKPKTFRDLNFMISTSKAWFDGCIKYENTNNPIEEGQVNSISWHVNAVHNYVEVYKSVHVICEVRNPHSFSCTAKRYTVARYNTIKEFESSEWYELAMDKFSDGCCDTSWMDSIQVDEKSVALDNCWTGYTAYTDVDMEVGTTYKDFLNNTRQKPQHDILSIRVDRMSGELSLYFQSYFIEHMTVEELQRAVSQYNTLKSLGVDVSSESISIPLQVDKDK